MKKLSVIVPVFNEEENVEKLYSRVKEVMETISNYDYEILYMDNRSKDKTFELIKSLASKDSKVRGVRYSRNFGYQRSIYQGFLECSGDMAIQLDCDLQDDPALIPEFLRKWEAGAKVVNGVRKDRVEKTSLKLMRKAYYRLVSILSEDELPLDVGEFRLIDRIVIEKIREVNDHQAYLRGLISQIGFTTASIEYKRQARELGETKFPLKELVKVAMDGILNHSVIPLRFATYFGLLIAAGVLALSCFYILGKLFWGQEWPAGFTTLAIITLFGIAINALFLGIIGEYLGRVYKQLKKQPIAIVEERVGEGISGER